MRPLMECLWLDKRLNEAVWMRAVRTGWGSP